MWKHDQKKGFAGQIIANGVSRLAYLALITHIHNNYSDSASDYVKNLVYAVALSSVLSWSVFQYSQSRDDQRTLQILSANRYQFCLTLTSLITIILLLLGARSSISFALLPILGLVSIVGMLIVNELAFSTNTLIYRESRSIIYYGTNFYLYASGLLLSTLTNLTWDQIIAVSGFPGLLAIILYFNKISKRFPSNKKNFYLTLYSRTIILMGNITMILIQPLAVEIIGQKSNKNITALMTEFLMLLSISGIVAFGFGNYFLFYGKQKLEYYMRATITHGYYRLLIGSALVIVACCFLAIPASTLYFYLKTGQLDVTLSASLILSLGFYAASIVYSQWFVASSIKIGRPIYILYSNTIFSGVLLLQLWGDFSNIQEVLLFSSLIKLILEIILYKKIININKRLHDRY